MRDNILRVTFGKETKIMSKPLYQYDYGQKLKFIDLTLPSVYEVHFSNYEHGESTTVVATSNEIGIPDTYFTSGRDIYVWIFLHTNIDDGETEYEINIPIIKRASITDEVPTEQEVSVVRQAIAALNAAVSNIASELSEAELAVRDAQAARDGAQAYMQSAGQYKTDCQNILAQVRDIDELGQIKIGSTILTEEQLIKLLQLIED